MQVTCAISGETFTVSEQELQLRKKFGFESLPTTKPAFRFRELGAFWPHWNLHKRTCDKSGQDIVSSFRPDCPYPVWNKDIWMKEADPPKAVYDFDRPFFDQAWELFQTCPIFHRTTAGCENCEYTDDWWYARNCYLCHSGVDCDGARYSYRCLGCKDILFCVFSYESEKCVDAINCVRCFETVHAFECKDVRNCAFMYDCRNCSDCMFCFNLRNKQYCIGNKQYSKVDYEEQIKKWNLTTHTGYNDAKKIFAKMMREIAWHRATFINKSENATGNYMENVQDMDDCFFLSHECEGCINTARGGVNVLHALDSLNIMSSQEVFYSMGAQDKCHDIRLCFSVQESRSLSYCGYTLQSESCFGCCGLTRQKYCVMNTPYGKAEYDKLSQKIIDHMKSTGEWGTFFPGHFAPQPYDESWSTSYWDVSASEQEQQGFRHMPPVEKKDAGYLSLDEVPSDPFSVDESITKKIFWDPVAHRPFVIQAADVNMCRNFGVALPNMYYTRRLRENFSWMPFSGELRETTCAKSGKIIQTGWPEQYDGRIVNEEEYLKIVT